MRRNYLIDHRTLFCFGFIFYLVIPYFAGKYNWFEGFPGISLYQDYFKMIPENQLFMYICISIGWLFSFYLGHWLYGLFQPPKRSLELFPQSISSWGISYISLVLVGLLALFAVTGRASLFAGYGSYDIGVRGKMSTLLVLCNFFLLYQLITRQRKSPILIFCTLLTALLLLSMGGRMYVFQTVVVYAIYKTSFAPRRWKFSQLAVFGMVGFFIGTLAGIWRSKASFSLDKAAYSFFAEPMFTWFSTSSYLGANEIPWLSIPSNHITSFYNLVPNSLISLRPYIVSTYAMVRNYQSPLGADSIWSTVVINFGSVGSCLFILATGFWLHFLQRISERSRFAAVYYISFCGMLPFQFFRDGFYIQHKQLLVNFLMAPGIILLSLKTAFFVIHQRSLKVSPNTSLSVTGRGY